MISRVFSFFVFIVLTGNITYSQISDSLFNMACEHEDMIILSEEIEVSITGKKTMLMIANITNKQTVLIKSLDGIKEFQPFILPKRIDELYIYHAPTVRNINWSYDNTFVNDFTASIKNGQTNEEYLSITPNTVSKRVINLEGYFGYVDEYEYYIDDLQIGDTLHLSYHLEIPFKDNWIKLLSNRIFFHGKYPKKSYKLKWCHNKNLEADTLFVNHDAPDLSLDGNMNCYSWNLTNLPGCLDEPQSRPYKTLPYFIFVPKSYDFEITHFNSYVMEFIPIYYLEAGNRQYDLETENWNNVIGIKNKNNNYYQKVANKIIASFSADDIGVGSMRYFQQYMVDSVNYDQATSYYNHDEDQKIQRGGVDLYGHRLKDNNIERVYANIVPKFGLSLFSAYPVDKRVGEISSLYNPTVLDNDMLFGIIFKDKTLGFVIPRSDKNHYYFEELPFYYEQNPVLLMHYNDFPSRLEKRNFNYEFRQTITPSSNWKDNYRKIQSKVLFNLNNNTADFQTRIILSGQYSTLTRCVYCQFPVDSTINPRYIEPIWDIADNVEVVSVKPTPPIIYYPFKTTIAAGYQANNLLKKKGNCLILKPGNWFKMIYSTDEGNETRFLDYYPDFVGSDSYTYMLEFDNPIKLISSENNIKVENSYGHLNFETKQIGENQILMTLSYIILSEIIDADLIGLVEEVNTAILEVSQKEIEFEIVK